MTPDVTLPDQATFGRLHRVGRSLPIALECSTIDNDPLELVAALPPESCAFLLETPGGPHDLERRSFLTWNPEWELRLRRGVLERRAQDGRITRERCEEPLAVLRALLRAEGAQPVPYEEGFSGGLVGYFAYEFKNWLERLPDTTTDDLGTADLQLGFVRRVVAWDHRARSTTVRIHHLCRSNRAHVDWSNAIEAAQVFRDEVLRLQTQVRRGAVPCPPSASIEANSSTSLRHAAAAARVSSTTQSCGTATKLRSNLERDAYDVMLAGAREHILAGDIYQANLSHRFEAEASDDGLALYRRLRQINPSPFATFMRFPEHQLISCSPERLARVCHGRVETRPIAGTRPRGLTGHEDASLERELLANDKERAEHLMIVDMARNDIGRVCELGSVQVESFMHVERYSHVRHLVSNIVGVLRGDCDAFDVLGATFPGASITGVPKVRCMQIIDELEEYKRGVYTGSAGYFGLDGAMDLNILIRTFLLQAGRAYFHVGGGIVADSDAESEYQETLAKGRALFDALQSARPATHDATRSSRAPAEVGSATPGVEARRDSRHQTPAPSGATKD